MVIRSLLERAERQGLHLAAPDAPPAYPVRLPAEVLYDALTQALDYKHVRYVLNDQVNENYANLIAGLAFSGFRFP